jgi:two-component system sensor histidine kinase KdpD
MSEAERIVVCVGPAPRSAGLVLAAARMAKQLSASWVAVSVTDASLDPEDLSRLDAHHRLTESLGGEVVRVTGRRTSEAVLEYAHAHHVTRIVVGKPTHPRMRDLVRGSLVDELIRGSARLEVHVLAGDDVPEAAPVPPVVSVRGFRWSDLAWASLLVTLATGAAWAWRALLAPADVVVVYLAVIMVAAIRFGRAPSVVSAALSVAAYDFFFVPPFFTFAVSDARNVLTFAMMFVVGLLLSNLTARVRRQELQARSRERRTAALYAVTRELALALDPREVARIAARHLADVFDADAAVFDATGEQPVQVEGKGEQGQSAVALATKVRRSGLAADDPAIGARGVPLGGQGALVVRPHGELLDVEQRHLLEIFARQITSTLERLRFAAEARTSALRAETEEMRSSLLSAVSHDLRTPLASITGAATTLRDAGLPPDQAVLIDDIVGEARRLERLVANLLDMTRLDSGAVTVKREWVPLDELVGAALTRLEGPLAGRAVHTTLGELPLISVDPVLIEQALVNLLENAVKYTPAASPLEISGRLVGDEVELEVADRGPGFGPDEAGRVFEKFFRGRGQVARGAGLGLAIVRGIALAHGGTVRAATRPGGGASFTLTLPTGGPPPMLEDTDDR